MLVASVDRREFYTALQRFTLPVMTTKLRVARPTDDLEAGAPYHLEFTHPRGHRGGRAPTADNLLVFYVPDPLQWNDAVARFKRAGYEAVPSFNPYWDRLGVTFEDPDGYRVVIQRDNWEA